MAHAILQRSTNLFVNSTAQKISWDSATEVGGDFWDIANPTRLIVPAGVTQLEVFFASYNVAISGSVPRCIIFKNGSGYAGSLVDGNGAFGFGLTTGLVPVTPGDYFEVEVANFSGTNTLDKDRTFMSAATKERLGFVYAKLSADLGFGGTPLVIGPWSTPAIDTESTWDGTNGFTVPTGANYALVHLNTNHTAFNSVTFTGFALLKDGVEIRRFSDRAGSWWGSGPTTFGVIPVTPGEVITCTVDGSSTLDASFTDIAIEWIA